VTPAEFKTKWAKVSAKESAAYQSHFDDLCRLLKLPPPLEADPTGEFFCFQKHVIKDGELIDIETPDASEPHERGFADVWKKNCFAWEYKGKKKNLDEAYKQLLRYRESLLNPPLLVVCDFDRYIVKTNFNGTVQEVHEFSNADIDRPENLRILRALFENPDFLKPQRTTAEITEKLAGKIAEVARLLQKRESVEIADATTRKAINFAQRKNLRIARFLNRIVFCFFAEDSGLLPEKLFSNIAKTALDDPKQFAAALEELFRVMAKGGMYGHHKIRHFNGHLFEEATVFELNEAELKILAEAAEADWQFIEPSIMGTLFERALDEAQRAQLGAHYTSETDIRTLVEPVLMSPLRREWSALKGGLTPAFKKGKASKEQRETLAAFLKSLSKITVLDPACGSGNFLYVSLQLLLDLEKEVITFATQLGLEFKPQVTVKQLKAIEINPYAYELAQVSVQIGFLQWRRDNGFDNDRTPVLQVLDGFENKDALMHETFKKKAKNLKAAREEEHQSQENLFKVYVERAWPECDVIVGNPPFLGTSKQWDELGRGYCEGLQTIFKGRVSGAADLCCYWFEKARYQIEEKKCKRAGLLATQGIRGGANREVLKRIKESGDIFFAESDREWVLCGAMVHVSMVGFDDGSETVRQLDGISEAAIHSNLTAHADVTTATPLKANESTAYSGTKKSGDFDIEEAIACAWLFAPNPHGKPNSDLIRPWLNGSAIVKRIPPTWIIDTGTDLELEAFALYAEPHAHALKYVKPQRDGNKREHRRLNWWLHAETCPGMRKAIHGQRRFLSTPRVSKFRIFSWADSVVLPDDGIYIFARSDDYFFGIVHSHIHEVWARSQGTQVRERESGFRYTPNTCFETFPFPRPTPAQEAAIAAAAKELNELRERWLNPTEWTEEKILEFPGSVAGPWSRYVVKPDKNGIGTVRYPRLEPKDAECAAKLKKRTLTNLYNERPAWLDLAHKKLDAAVAASYGFDADLTDEQILEKLLALNLERAAEETATVKVSKPKTQRAKHVEEMI
jgi:type II restriction/modification system DNA methylase subunit YeeA